MNYLSVIYEEHLIKAYCTGSWWGIGVCTTCACNKLRTRLFDAIVDELNINPEETGTKEFFRGLRNVTNTKLLKDMIENICENFNRLDDRETRSIGGMPDNSDVPRFVRGSILVFVILEIWDALMIVCLHDREDALRCFLDLTQNEVVIKLIQSMDEHYRSLRSS